MDESGDNPSERLAASLVSSDEVKCDTTTQTKVGCVNAESAAENEYKAIATESSGGSQTATVDEHDVFDSERVSTVVVSAISSEAETWVADLSRGEVLKSIMDQLASLEISKLEEPQLDDICAARDPTDKKWYRAKVIAVKPAISVLFVDFGNQAEVAEENVVLLPDELKRDPPLAQKAHLVWEKSSNSEATASVGDILEVKYDGKEADGVIKLEVLSVKTSEGTDEIDFDEDNAGAGKGVPVPVLTWKEEEADVCTRSNGNGSTVDEQTGNELGDEAEPRPASAHQLTQDQLEEAEEASNLRAEAHATVQELLKELEEQLPGQDEHAQQARLQVQEAMKDLDGRLPLQEEVAMQTRLEFQKIMESLDERLQKQQEAALASMRQMMEKTLSESLRKIDRIQRDLHKLYERTSANSSKPPRRDHPDNQQTVDAERGNRSEELAYHRNQYNRQPYRNFGAPTSDLPSDRARFDHFGSKAGEQRVMSAALAMRQVKDLSHRLAKGSPAGPEREPNHPRGIPQPQLKPPQESAPAEKRSVSFRLQQARGVVESGDSKLNNNCFASPTTAAASNIISVTSLPEAINIDYLCTLFGLYGNVVRAKVLYQQKGRALVEMEDANQTAATMSILNGTQIFGQTIHLRHCTFEKLIINPKELTNNTAKDYSKLNSYQLNSVRRFKKGVYDPSRFMPPSETLRVNNILKTVPDDDVKAAFVEKGFVFKNIFFIQGSADKKSAFVTFESVDEAFKAMHALHNVELRDWMPMKISFGTQKRQ